MGKTISELIKEYFISHPNQDIPHGPVVDWVAAEYLKYNDNPPRDTWRAIRNLHQEGFLIKIKKGVFRYDPDKVTQKILFDFPPDIKEQIFKRDGYKCIWCGRGPKDGVELCADHIKPKDLGGDNSLENGQTLCTEHNLIKKNYTQTEAGKRYFIKLYEKALKTNDKKMIKFCQGIFDIYDKFGVNGHIKRPNGDSTNHTS